MTRSHQVKRPATVAGLIVLVSSAAGLWCFAVRAKAASKRPGEVQVRGGVIVDDVIVADGNVRGADNQDSLEQCVLYRELGYGHIVESGIVEAIHKDAMCKICGVDHGGVGVGANQRQRHPDGDLLLVNAGCDVNRVARFRVIDCGLD